MYIEEIQNIIRDINPYIDINENTELIDTGILDSLSILFVITQLEDKFGICIDEKLVLPENFKTVILINEMISKCVRRD